ncbi:glycoside hydrolase family 38 N-terminal domain-containing protein [Catenuloplanes japonicus]|uniref:glycoside hydrolase family 38 N-terminal domain-containing protein n=1 Tax=Catenuloplanes japonicus TaxID=33876 RepID=UPI0005257D88|nr:glycoside hydrolase family 38 C-terminal domain-containing protein [Catenuloplanes japonicus]
MTAKTLTARSSWDWDTARDNLKDRATTAFAGPIRLQAEPLLRRSAMGQRQQSVRVRAGRPLTRATARTASGAELLADVLPAPDGLRLLLPEVTSPQTITVELPEAAPGRPIELVVEPVRQWEIHLVHHSHLDIGYTDPQGRVLAEHLSYLDSTLDLLRETDGWPDDSRFRWSVESLLSFEQWCANRPAAAVRDMIDRVREGRIELTALPFNLHTETCSTDELHELLRTAKDLRDRHGLDIPVAMQTDVPGAVGGLVDVLAQNRVRYLSVAHNWAGRSVPHLTGGQDVPRLFWWHAPSGERVLVWSTDTPHGLAYMEGSVLGFDVSYDMVDDLLPAYLTALSTRPYPYDGSAFGFPVPDAPLHRPPYPWDILHLRVQGRFGDNAPPRRIMAETVRRWNDQWVYPRLRLSRNEDFFTEAERRYGDRVPAFTGSWNDWWADGIGSGARPLQLVRRAQVAVADAQTVSALAGLHGADGAATDTADARDVYRNASIFDEHTWGAADPWTHGDDHTHSGEEQWHWKYHTALAARDDAERLLTRAANRLAGTLDGGAAVYAVNTAAYPRAGVVTAFLPESRVPIETPLAVVDRRTGKVLPSEETPQVNPTHRQAGRFLHIAVDEVPALGVVRLDLREPVEAAPLIPATAATVLENDELRVEVDLATSGICSILDKRTGTELVNARATFSFNAYVYDHYASAGGINHQSSKTEASANLALLGSRRTARPAALVDAGRTAVRQWLTYEAVAPGADWIRTTLTLRPGTGALEIENRVSKRATMTKESGFFAFPFALDQPVLRIDTTATVNGTDLPHVPGGAAHMQAIRHWIGLHAGDVGAAWVTVDAPLVQLGAIVVPYAPFPVSTPSHEPGTVYSWVHNNLWDTNFPSRQAFEMTFRYRVAARESTSPDATSAFATRIAADAINPLIAVVAADSAREQPPAATSALRLSDERVRLVGLTTPEPGYLLARLQSVAGTPVDCTLSLGFPADAAWSATYLGEKRSTLALHDANVTVTVPALGTTAVLLHTPTKEE